MKKKTMKYEIRMMPAKRNQRAFGVWGWFVAIAFAIYVLSKH